MAEIKVLIVSDTHGKLRELKKCIEKTQSDMVIHLGDGEREQEYVVSHLPGPDYVFVKGNCDFGSDEPLHRLIEIEGIKLFLTHGHEYSVKSGYDRLFSEAERRGADIALFGHTHIPVKTKREGVTLFNPGSLGMPRSGRPSCGILDISSTGTMLYHIEV